MSKLDALRAARERHATKTAHRTIPADPPAPQAPTPPPKRGESRGAPRKGGKGGRPKLPKTRTSKLHVALYPEELAALQLYVGDCPVGRWARAVLLRALGMKDPTRPGASWV